MAADLNRKVHGGNAIFKLDMSKAYDRVSWAFFLFCWFVQLIMVASNPTKSPSSMSHIRKSILITLSHAERSGRNQLDKHTILDRVLSFLRPTNMNSIIISQETHSSGGYHYHRDY